MQEGLRVLPHLHLLAAMRQQQVDHTLVFLFELQLFEILLDIIVWEVPSIGWLLYLAGVDIRLLADQDLQLRAVALQEGRQLINDECHTRHIPVSRGYLNRVDVFLFDAPPQVGSHL